MPLVRTFRDKYANSVFLTIQNQIYRIVVFCWLHSIVLCFQNTIVTHQNNNRKKMCRFWWRKTRNLRKREITVKNRNTFCFRLKFPFVTKHAQNTSKTKNNLSKMRFSLALRCLMHFVFFPLGYWTNMNETDNKIAG